MSKALLPAGFHDLLYPEASYQADIVARLSKSFEDNGYFKVNPPAMEFEESLFSGAGKSLENSTFRLMDPLSHKMMGLRADMTVQVARIAVSRLAMEPLPLRLSYSGEVFRVKGEGLYAERQLVQAGIELIGADTPDSDAEVVQMVVEALKKVGVTDLCVDFTIPGLVEIILEHLEIAADDKDIVIAAIKKKDTSYISKLGGKKTELLISLIDTDITVEKLLAIKLPKQAADLCYRLKDVLDILKNNIEDVAISIDPAEVVLSDYHNTIGFSVFSRKSRDEIGRGGRYVTDNNQSGVGATLYVNELFRILPKPIERKKVLVSYSASAEQIIKLHEKGFIVIRALGKQKDYRQEAIRLKCQYFFENNDIVAVS